MSEKKRPNCYDCQHRGEVPGSAHSSCAHPEVGESDPITKVFSLLGGGRSLPVGLVQEAATKLKIKANFHGIKNGWFNWPHNFDPAWLENCEGFSEVKKE